MPFCRKCGRRLPEYSEVCTDCGQSTTAPMINLKKTKGSELNFKGAEVPKKIAKATIPEKNTVTAKTTAPTALPAKVLPKTEPVNPPKTVVQSNPPPATKPYLSAKHIVKPKKTRQSKPVAPFTIAFARPVAGPNLVQRKSVSSPKPIAQPILLDQPKPVAQSNLVVSSAKPAPAKTATISAKPTLVEITAPLTQVAPPKPVTPAVVYPPHEIIQSNVSLKQDIISNPHDYETQTFDFDLKCPHGHFWAAGRELPVSKGIAFCIKCGERLRKPTRKKRRYRMRI